MVSPRRLAAGFFLRLIVAYALLMLSWPGVEHGYARLFRAAAQAVFSDFGRDGVVRLEPRLPSNSAHDTSLIVTNRRTGSSFVLGVSSRYFGYVPTAFLVALTISTPLPWRRRGQALAYGLLAIHGWIAVTVILLIVHGFSFSVPPLLYDLPLLPSYALAGLAQVIQVAPLNWLVVPLFIWLMVTFRRGDLAAMLE